MSEERRHGSKDSQPPDRSRCEPAGCVASSSVPASQTSTIGCSASTRRRRTRRIGRPARRCTSRRDGPGRTPLGSGCRAPPHRGAARASTSVRATAEAADPSATPRAVACCGWRRTRNTAATDSGPRSRRWTNSSSDHRRQARSSCAAARRSSIDVSDDRPCRTPNRHRGPGNTRVSSGRVRSCSCDRAVQLAGQLVSGHPRPRSAGRVDRRRR